MRTVFLAMVLFLAVLASVAGFVLAFDASWPTRVADSWKDLIELTVIATAALFGLVQLNLLLRQAREQQEQRLEENKKEQARETLKLDAKLGEDDVDLNRKAVQAVFPPEAWKNKTIPLEHLRSKFEADDELEGKLVSMLGILEMFALPVYARVADERMAFELIGGTLVWYATAFHEFIQQRNRDQGRTDWCIYLVALGGRWKRQIESEAGLAPFYIRRGLPEMDV